MRCSGVGGRCRGVGRQTRVVSQIDIPFTYGIAECRGVACEQSRSSLLHQWPSTTCTLTLSTSASNCGFRAKKIMIPR